MSDYVIKQYQEEFIEDQFKVGSEVVKDWKFFGQTSVEELKQSYSQEDFDPETRLYCFKDEKLVGFLTAAVNETEEERFGFLRLPFVLPEHKDAEELLFNEIVEVFKKKGIKKIRAQASNLWGNSLELVKKWNFDKKDENFYVYIADLKEVAVDKNDKIEIRSFDYEKDVEPMVEIFKEKYGYTEEAAKQNFETIKNFDRVIAHLIVQKDENIVGRALAYLTDDPKLAINGFMFGDDDVKKAMLSEIIEKSKEKEVEKLQMFFNLPNKQLIPAYEKLGFKLDGKGINFEKEI
ncbi:MAG: hypothetical protein ACFFDS_01605 [Candidatus Thorarchaeota archaeon]